MRYTEMILMLRLTFIVMPKKIKLHIFTNLFSEKGFITQLKLNRFRFGGHQNSSTGTIESDQLKKHDCQFASVLSL